jgi:hypothetical protein
LLAYLSLIFYVETRKCLKCLGRSRGYFGFGPVRRRRKLFGFRRLQTIILKGLFSYLVYTFGGVKVSPPIENGQGGVISHGGGGPKTTQIKHIFFIVFHLFSYSGSLPWGVGLLKRFPPRGLKPPKLSNFPFFFIVWLKNTLPQTFILFYMCRIIFVLHLNPYFVTVGHCPGGMGAT